MPVRTHEVPHHPRHGALVGVLVEYGNEFHCVEALIDNGSNRSLLPYAAVAELGLKGTLRRTRGIRVAGGGRVRAWRTRVSLQAQIATFIEGKADYIGPKIPLDPWFVKPPRKRFGGASTEPRPLVGREDFLDFFRYQKTDKAFILEWDE